MSQLEQIPNTQRNQLLANALIAFGLDHILERVKVLVSAYDPVDWRKAADDLGINPKALDVLERASVPYPYYFCNPAQLADNPSLLRYYRSLAMLSAKSMREIDLDSLPYESGMPLARERAAEFARYFNWTVSSIVVAIEPLIAPQTHIELVLTNLGDNIGSL